MTTLKDALAIAGRYTDPKKVGEGLAAVVLRDNIVRAHNGMAGVAIPCDDADVGMAVNCHALTKMIGAIGSGASMTKIKGRKLAIKGGGSKFTVPAIPKAKEPNFPDDPPAIVEWLKLTKEQTAAIAAVAALAPKKDGGTFAMSGLRLTPTWVATATASSVTVAWVQNTVAEPLTIPATVMANLVGEVELTVHGGKLFVREVESGIVRWSLGLTQEWPDRSVDGMIAQAREEDTRVVVGLDMEQLGLLAKQAAVVSEGKLAVFTLTLEPGILTLAGSNKMSDAGHTNFRGAMECTTPEGFDDSRVVGVNPDDVMSACEAATSVDADKYLVSIAAPQSPILMWGHGGDQIIEALTMPQHIEATAGE
tara:strand:- start:363 stop:1457 length:1095 start_codon:yes stop_codon:yes gene_type:complete